jgi:NAD(P)-dependent dehydrogenase (short-subunit alcohol dehydrogenase family)
MSVKAFAVIAGVGSGTGTWLARRFANEYPVALLARNPESYEGIVKEINGDGGKAIGISTDVSNEESVKSAFKTIAQAYNNAPCAAAIYNASGGFVRRPFLDTRVEELDKGWAVTVYEIVRSKQSDDETDCLHSKGALFFAQATLPSMLKHADDQNAKYPPTIIFTGATASIKANAQMATFAAPKWALRALSTSLAKEFAPKGVHVVHAIIDGAIDIPKSQEMLKNLAWEARVGPEDIAKSYWDLHTQGRRGFTNEVDVRPMHEKW